MGRKRVVVEAERQRIRQNLDRHRVDVVHGSARFVDPHAIEVVPAAGEPSRRVEGATFLIAVGSSPHRPAAIDFAHPLIHDSDEILELEEVPRSLIVVGAGVIGCEYATMFAALGMPVHLVEPRDTLLPFVDREMARRLQETMTGRLGIDLRFGASWKEVRPHDDRVEVVLTDGATLSAHQLLFAAGRGGNTADLGLDVLGLVPDKRGQLQVDAHYRTAVPHVYAVGDVIGFPALASVSMEQARVAVVHAFDLRYKERVSPLLPYGIYTIPEVSMIGETEESARQSGLDVETGRASYAANARGQIIGDASGLIKLVFRRDDKRLVGAHVVGENAAEIIHVASAVLHFGGTIDAFIEMVFNFPTLCDAYKYAAYDGLGRLAGRPGPSSVTQIQNA
jgi:NAD(P) transhydrogenase